MRFFFLVLKKAEDKKPEWALGIAGKKQRSGAQNSCMSGKDNAGRIQVPHGTPVANGKRDSTTNL